MVGGTMPNPIQEVRKKSQCCNAMNFLEVTMSVCESKLKGPCKKQDESVKWTESVYIIYFG